MRQMPAAFRAIRQQLILPSVLGARSRDESTHRSIDPQLIKPSPLRFRPTARVLSDSTTGSVSTYSLQWTIIVAIVPNCGISIRVCRGIGRTEITHQRGQPGGAGPPPSDKSSKASRLLSVPRHPASQHARTSGPVMTKILVYSHDTYGLGNIRRMTSIAEAIVNSDDDASILIITGSPMLHAFRLGARIDYVKLPCLDRTAAGRYAVKHLPISSRSAMRMRAGIIAAAAIDFDPDLVLVDKKPLGVGGELRATLEILNARARPPAIHLILRDILDGPEATREVWEKNGYHDAIALHFDRIIVVGQREIFDLAEEYGFPASTRNRMDYVGYLRRSAGNAPASDIRRRLGIGSERIVLVQAGGGADGAALIHAHLHALRGYPGKPPFFSWIVSGPEMKESDRRRIIHAIAALPNVVHQDFVEDMNAAMNAADFIVSMGGYNTACEILSLRKPALIAPRVSPVEEQWIRAERFARKGMVECLHPNELMTPRYGDALRRMIDGGKEQLDARGPISLNGHAGVLSIVRRTSPGLAQIESRRRAAQC